MPPRIAGSGPKGAVLIWINVKRRRVGDHEAPNFRLISGADMSDPHLVSPLTVERIPAAFPLVSVLEAGASPRPNPRLIPTAHPHSRLTVPV